MLINTAHRWIQYRTWCVRKFNFDFYTNFLLFMIPIPLNSINWKWSEIVNLLIIIEN